MASKPTKKTAKNHRAYPDMPQIVTSSALPDMFLAKANLKLWILISIAIALLPPSLMAALGLIDGSTRQIRAELGAQIFLFPSLTFFILFFQPVFRRSLHDIIKEYRKFHTSIICEMPPQIGWIALNKHFEWLVFGLSSLAGCLSAKPWEPMVGIFPWYRVISAGIIAGLLGWTIYHILLGTKFISFLQDQVDGFEALSHKSLSAIIRWSGTVGFFFIGLVAITLIFVWQTLAIVSVIIYAVLALIVLFVFLYAGVSKSQLSQFRVVRAVILFIMVVLMGTLGYHKLEGWDLLDGLYMTVITVTTIGFGETGPLSRTGQIYTMILGLVSIGIAGYAVSSIAAFIVEGDLNKMIKRQRMDRKISKLTDHIILCGAGRVGTQIALEFHQAQVPFLIIERDQRVIDEVLRKSGDTPYIQGDATKDEVLRVAGVERAKGLIAALRDDKDNVFTILSARSLNPKLRIVSRLTDEENAEKLRKVGANEIVSTNIIGGLRMASIMIRPSVVTFLDEMLRVTGQTLRMEEVYISDDSSLIGQTLGEADIGRKTGLLVVAINSGENGYQFNPGAKTTLNRNDLLIVIGTSEQLTLLKQIA